MTRVIGVVLRLDTLEVHPMVMVFRQADPRNPFLWEDGTNQPPCRWKGPGVTEPVHCFADTPDGAWAEFLRHEEVTDPDDLKGIERDIWAVEIRALPVDRSRLSRAELTGDASTYPACQAEAERLVRGGTTEFTSSSAALIPRGARGWRVCRGLNPGPDRDGEVLVLVGARPDLVGWRSTRRGRPGRDLLPLVNHL